MWAARLRNAVILLLLAGSGLWLAAPFIIEFAAARLLAANGLGPARLTLVSMGLHRAELGNIHLGATNPIRIDRLSLDYQPLELLAGRIESMSVSGLKLPVSVGPPGTRVGPLKLAAGQGGAGIALHLGRLDLRDAEIVLGTPYGAADIAVVGVLQQPLTPQTTEGVLDMRFHGDGASGNARLQLEPGGRIEITLDRTSLHWSSIDASDIAGVLKTTIAGLASERKLQADLTGQALALPGVALRDLKLKATTATEAIDGHLTAAVAGGGHVDLAARLTGLGQAAPQATLQGQVDPGGGLPPVNLQIVARRLAAAGERAQITLQLASPGGKLGDARLGAGKLDANLQADWANGILAITPTTALSVSISSLRQGDFHLPHGVKFEIAAAAKPAWRIDIAGSEPGSIEHDFTAKVPSFAAGIAGHDLGFGDIALASQGQWQPGGAWLGKTTLQATSLHLKQPEIKAGATSGELAAEPGKAPKLTASAKDVSGSKWLPPAVVTADASLAHWRDANFTVKAEAAGGKLTWTLKGQHDLRSGKGTARFRLQPIEFADGGLQPADLSPALKGEVTGASGKLALAGSAAWDPGKPLQSRLRLLLQDLSFSAGSIAIGKLNTVTALDQLWPPATASRQELAIGEINLGVPLSEALIGFDLKRDGSALLQLEQLKLGGGTVTAQNILAHPLEGRLDAVLQVQGVELQQLLSLSGLEGVSTSGTLAGQIPIRLRGETAEIHGGRLDTAGPGIIRYQPKTLPAALQGQDQGTKLLVTALQNLHYQSLWLSLERAADGETVVGLHINGANPDLYGGYPVELNINLSGKLDQIVRHSLEGYRVPEQIRQRMLNFGQGD